MTDDNYLIGVRLKRTWVGWLGSFGMAPEYLIVDSVKYDSQDEPYAIIGTPDGPSRFSTVEIQGWNRRRDMPVGYKRA